MKTIPLTLLALVLGLAGGVVLERQGLLPHAVKQKANHGLEAIATTPKQRYVCPMHPEIVRDHPDHCPICGMELVPVKAASHEHHEAGGMPEVTISPAVVNNLGMRIAPVTRQTLARRFDVTGHVVRYLRGRRRLLRIPAPGIVKHLLVTDGATVKKGQLLAEIRSPQREAALAAYRQQQQQLQDDTDTETRAPLIEGLRELAFTQVDIDRLAQGEAVSADLKLVAPVDGRISELSSVQGDAVDPAKPLMALTETGRTLVEADVFRSQVAWVKSGARAQLRLANQPGKVWEGRVSTQGTDLRPRTRTYAMRVSFQMPEGLALADMYADVTLFGEPHENSLVIPREALIRTGDSQRVVKVVAHGHFQPVAVTTGIESGNQVEILSGLKENDQVVVSAQFLIDSESNLLAGLQRLDAGADTKSSTSPDNHHP